MTHRVEVANLLRDDKSTTIYETYYTRYTFSQSLAGRTAYLSLTLAIPMTSHKIKIAARVRPRLENELDDQGIQIAHTPGGPSCISVPNPRDLSQVFNFP